jgi:rRNA maturation endonuclease Nob1
MEEPQLTEQERTEILEQLHRREFLEKTALEQQKKVREAEAERQYRQSIADAARRTEEEHRERLLTNFTTLIKLTQQALEAFQAGDESQSYRLLVKGDVLFINVKSQLNQKPQRPSNGSVPTLRVKRDTPLGFALINATDLSPTDVVLEDNE